MADNQITEPSTHISDNRSYGGGAAAFATSSPVVEVLGELSMNTQRSNKSLQRMAAPRCCGKRCVSLPPSLSLIR
jgi:hypothetical protein